MPFNIRNYLQLFSHLMICSFIALHFVTLEVRSAVLTSVHRIKSYFICFRRLTANAVPKKDVVVLIVVS